MNQKQLSQAVRMQPVQSHCAFGQRQARLLHALYWFASPGRAVPRQRLLRRGFAASTRMLLLGFGLGGLGCGGTDEPAKADPCGEGLVPEQGACVPDPFRHEPEQQLDLDNVRYYSSEPLSILKLPPPPKSGFRIIMEPQVVEPGEDFYPCQAWEIPELEHDWVYTAVLHTSPGLHHANLYGVDVDPERGPNPYPGCNQRADGQVFGQLSGLLGGQELSTLSAPDVLFANSTQVIGSERYALPPGYAYQLRRGGEVTTDVHLQNPTPEPLRVEAAWDFYTMPRELVENEVSMFVNVWLDFKLPPQSQKTLTADCAWDGGEVVAIMPHTHEWATGFDVSFGQGDLYPSGVLAGQPRVGSLDQIVTAPYQRQDTGLADSDIEVYSPPVVTDGADTVRFQCHYANDTDQDMCNGFANHEMCFLFGYVSPPSKQRIGVVPTEGAPCISINPTTASGTFSTTEYFGLAEPDVQQRLLKLFTGGADLFGGCTE